MKLPRTIRPAPILAAVLSLCLAGYLAVWPALGYTADRPLPIYCVDRPEKVCAISFDAAWGADNTQGILDVLAKYNVKATFFVVGNWADQYPQQAKAIVESGCELMNHSNAHGHFNSMSTAEIQADVTACNDKIEALTGVRPTLIRCPFGEYDDHVITAIREMGMEPIQWDVDSLDWKGSRTGSRKKSPPAPSSSSTTPGSTRRRPCPASWTTSWPRATRSSPSARSFSPGNTPSTTPAASSRREKKSPEGLFFLSRSGSPGCSASPRPSPGSSAPQRGSTG